MLKSSKGDYKELEKLEGNMENPNKKAIEELSSFDKIYEQSYGDYIDNLDIEKEEDGKLIERIADKFNIENYQIVKFMPQYIFAKNLRIIVKDRKINHAEFEEKYGLGAKMLSKYINGHQFPDFTIMCKIAYGLDMSVYQLLEMSKFTSLPVEEINKITGLSENSLRVLFMLQHNTTEFEELTDDIPISKTNKAKLDIFNSFIEDNVNFFKFLNHLEQYTKLKERARKEKNNCKEDIKSQLLRTKRRYDKYIT